jgi:hypothetical protein
MAMLRPAGQLVFRPRWTGHMNKHVTARALELASSQFFGGLNMLIAVRASEFEFLHN